MVLFFRNLQETKAMDLNIAYAILLIGSLVFFRTIFLKSTQSRKHWNRFLGFLLVWFFYLFILQKNEVLNSLNLPPRLPLLVVVPLILGFTSLLFTSFKKQLNLISPSDLVLVQSFRIGVELVFYLAFLWSDFPKLGTFLGQNYEMFFAITAVPLGLYLAKKTINSWLVAAWHFIGILVLGHTIFLFIENVFITTNESVALPLINNLTFFPGLIIPGLLAPMAIWIHVLGIRKAVFLKD